MKYLVVFFMFFVLSCESNTRTIVIDETTDEVTDEATDETTDEVTDEVTDEATDEVTDEATDEVTDEVTDEATDEVTDEVTDEATDEATDEVTDEDIEFKNFFSTKILADNPLIEKSLKKAKAYCDSLVENDFNDWRLPTLKEGQLLITNCPGMDPFQFECIINQDENKMEGCERCQDTSKNFALFEEDSEFIITDRIPSTNYLIGIVDATEGVIRINSGNLFGAVRCIRGNPFATE